MHAGETVKRAENGVDDVDGNLIVHIRDEMLDHRGQVFSVLDLLGTGTYGQVRRLREIERDWRGIE